MTHLNDSSVVPTTAPARVQVIVGDPRTWSRTHAAIADVPAGALRTAGGLAWVDIPGGQLYGAVLACPGGVAAGVDVAEDPTWMLLVDDRHVDYGGAATWRRLLAAGFTPTTPTPVPVPVPPRWTQVRVLDERAGAWSTGVWLTHACMPMLRCTVWDRAGMATAVVVLDGDLTRGPITAAVDPHADLSSAAALRANPAWVAQARARDLPEDYQVRWSAAAYLRTEVAFLLGAPVVTGVHLSDPDALATIPGWEQHLPADVVDEVVEELWAANRDDLLPGPTP